MDSGIGSIRWGIIEISLSGSTQEHVKIGAGSIELDKDGNASRLEELELSKSNVERRTFSFSRVILNDNDIYGTGESGGIELEGGGNGCNDLTDVCGHVLVIWRDRGKREKGIEACVRFGAQ